MSNTRRSEVDCTHVQLEFVSCTDGEITWKCVMPLCHYTEIQYHDTCSGG